MPLFAVTILLGAFLLFQVQPLIGKIILPWFGGSAAVWSAALLFFQVFLLGGYAYAHFVVRRFQPRHQLLVHVALLGMSCALLPILPSPSWKPSSSADPTLRILALLAVSVGLPYFLLSSTSPLLQAWYVRRTGTRVPYRWFALSNFGSMLGLLSFPFLVEPNLTSRQQAYGWSGSYIAFAALCALVAWKSRQDAPAPEPLVAAGGSRRPRPHELVLWVSLASCASALLVAVTTHLTQNVAPVPLLWVVPLTLYLVTFILAFEGDHVYRRSILAPVLVPAIGLMAYLNLYSNGANVPIKWLIPTFLLGLFVCCMVCHGELAVRRPPPEHLTLFYLMVSLGGALGGLFVAILAPVLFESNLELAIVLAATASLATIVFWEVRIPKLGYFPMRMLLFLGLLMTIVTLAQEVRLKAGGNRVMERNFYGVLRVADDAAGSPQQAARRLFHGTIEHGSQLLDERYRRTPTTYYGEESGAGRAIRALQVEREEMRVGVIGLGAGVLTSYGRSGDFYEFFEINPEVERIAQQEFSFYEQSIATRRILLGDARITLEQLPPQRFDVLIVDAFSGDAVPVHLLTEEALAVYFRHLKADGILALHLSNLYLDLIPVAARGADEAAKVAMAVHDDGDTYTDSNVWVLITSDVGIFDSQAFEGAQIQRAVAPEGFRAWTDSYSNLFQVLKLE